MVKNPDLHEMRECKSSDGKYNMVIMGVASCTRTFLLAIWHHGRSG